MDRKTIEQGLSLVIILVTIQIDYLFAFVADGLGGLKDERTRGNWLSKHFMLIQLLRLHVFQNMSWEDWEIQITFEEGISIFKLKN